MENCDRQHRQKAKKIVVSSLLMAAMIAFSLHVAVFFSTKGEPLYTSSSSSSSSSPSLVIPSIPSIPSMAVANEYESGYGSGALKPRYRFRSYDEYIQLQLKKTLNPRLRALWTSRDWRRKVNVFSKRFGELMQDGIVANKSKALCIGARVGQEVLALKEIGVEDAIGIDLVPYPPLVIGGDMHRHPFRNQTFDFEFSNVFDHALYPAVFASEIERTLKPGGFAVLHVSLRRRGDKYSANDLFHADALVSLFHNSDFVRSREVDAFGLDTEIVLRKHFPPSSPSLSLPSTCPNNTHKSGITRQSLILNSAEPLLANEPLKPWLAFKRNLKNIKYLPSLTPLSHFRHHIYIDIGARSYQSSIGSWFAKTYPTQGHKFKIYAIEADPSFAPDYVNHTRVEFLPYAAWVRNETVRFGVSKENKAAEGEHGMGHILTQTTTSSTDIDNDDSVVVEDNNSRSVRGFDFAEWLPKVASPLDFVVVKMDIEGTEFQLLPKLLETGAICLIDELFLECHYNRWQRTSPKRTPKFTKTYSDCLSLLKSLRSHGVLAHQWW